MAWLKQHQKKTGGIIKHNTNAVKNMAATRTQALPGDNVDEGTRPEPPAKKTKQPDQPAATVPARGRGGAGVRVGGGPFGSRASRQAAMAVAAAATRVRCGGPGRNRM
eukprot:jgi/Tetstr1/436466/TSEL_025294.t1